jgi:hypothetical protein
MLKRILAIKLMVLAVCVLGLSGAQAAVLLQWIDGVAPTAGMGYSGSGGITYRYTADSATAQTIQVTLTVASGYSASGLTAYFALAGGGLATGATITVNGDPYTANGSNLGILSFPDIVNGGNAIATFTIDSISGGKLNNGSKSIDFTPVTFAGTVTAVPEPINYALAVFGVCAVGIGAARRLVKKADA